MRAKRNCDTSALRLRDSVFCSYVNIFLQGHSLGCDKTIEYAVNEMVQILPERYTYSEIGGTFILI